MCAYAWHVHVLMCMCMCMRMCMCMCMRMRMRMCMHMYAQLSCGALMVLASVPSVHSQSHACMCTRMHTHAHACSRMHMCTRIRMYMCTHRAMHTCVHMQVLIMDAVYAIVLMEGAQNCPSIVDPDFSALKSEFPPDP